MAAIAVLTFWQGQTILELLNEEVALVQPFAELLDLIVFSLKLLSKDHEHLANRCGGVRRLISLTGLRLVKEAEAFSKECLAHPVGIRLVLGAELLDLLRARQHHSPLLRSAVSHNLPNEPADCDVRLGGELSGFPDGEEVIFDGLMGKQGNRTLRRVPIQVAEVAVGANSRVNSLE